jgi:predicted  nucleic acid-binding Zn-ribbon protein
VLLQLGVELCAEEERTSELHAALEQCEAELAGFKQRYLSWEQHADAAHAQLENMQREVEAAEAAADAAHRELAARAVAHLDEMRAAHAAEACAAQEADALAAQVEALEARVRVLEAEACARQGELDESCTTMRAMVRTQSRLLRRRVHWSRCGTLQWATPTAL